MSKWRAAGGEDAHSSICSLDFEKRQVSKLWEDSQNVVMNQRWNDEPKRPRTLWFCDRANSVVSEPHVYTHIETLTVLQNGTFKILFGCMSSREKGRSGDLRWWEERVWVRLWLCICDMTVYSTRWYDGIYHRVIWRYITKSDMTAYITGWYDGRAARFGAKW